MADEIKDVLAQLVQALKGSSGGSEVLAGQPTINVILKVKDKATGKIIPYPLDTATAQIVRYGQWLGAAVLGTGTTTIFTAGRAYSDIVILVGNVDSVSRTFSLRFKPLGAADTNSQVFTGLTVPLAVGAPMAFTLPGMRATDVIAGLCSSASSVSVNVWGVPQQ